MKIANRLFDILEAGKTSIGGVVTMSDLIVSELAGDCGMDFSVAKADGYFDAIVPFSRLLGLN